MSDLTSLSQSSLQDFTDCPRRFQLRYLEQLNYPALESEPALENEKHQQEGLSFHRLIHQRLIGVSTELLSKSANSPNLARWWQNYSDYDFAINDYTKFPEVTLSAPLGQYRLIAKYDLIALKPGEHAIIFDWKTYRKRPRNDWLAARLQTRVYRALLIQAGIYLNHGQSLQPEQVEMVYWFADYPRDPARFTYDPAQFKRDWDSLLTLAHEIAAAAEYPKTDDRQRCVYCPYRSYCDRGQQAGDYAELEAGMEAETLFDVNFEQISEIAF